jgi:hypothetical protein
MPFRSVSSDQTYSPIIYDLRLRWPCLCSRFQVAPPLDEERLIQTYAVGSWTCGNLKAVRIAINVSGDLIDIRIFHISISRKVCISIPLKSKLEIAPMPL